MKSSLMVLLVSLGLNPLAEAKDIRLALKFVDVPAGEFMMGTPREAKFSSSILKNSTPQHKIVFTKGFQIQATEVTQKEFFLILGRNPSFTAYKEDCPQDYEEINGVPLCSSHPVDGATWFDAQDFIAELNKLNDGFEYRLPNEAEWEYAARAGASGPYWFGSSPKKLKDHAWFLGNSKGHSHPVNSKLPNALGLYGIHGNASEWVQDIWYSYPNAQGTITDPKSHEPDPELPESEALKLPRVVRGGSWFDDDWGVRVDYRLRADPQLTKRHSDPMLPDGYGVGFRLVRNPR